MISNILTKIFGSRNERLLKQYGQVVRRINALDAPTAALSDDELRALIRQLEREEDDISLRRRFLHGQIEILRAARYARLRDGSVDVSDLARVLTTRLPKSTDGQA